MGELVGEVPDEVDEVGVVGDEALDTGEILLVVGNGVMDLRRRFTNRRRREDGVEGGHGPLNLTAGHRILLRENPLSVVIAVSWGLRVLEPSTVMLSQPLDPYGDSFFVIDDQFGSRDNLTVMVFDSLFNTRRAIVWTPLISLWGFKGIREVRVLRFFDLFLLIHE